jgi:hypothetical protein
VGVAGLDRLRCRKPAVRTCYARGRSARGASAVAIESDPNAEGFYLRMGARRVGENVYEIEGPKRKLPLLTVEISKPAQG